MGLPIEGSVQLIFQSLNVLGRPLCGLFRKLPRTDATQMWASRKLFDSLVLISASPRYIDDDHYSGGFTKQEVVKLLRKIRSDYAHWSEQMAPVFMGNPARPELADELLESFRRTHPTIAAAFAQAIFTSDWRRELAQVTADCLVVQSEKDPVVPFSVGEYLSAHITGGILRPSPPRVTFPT